MGVVAAVVVGAVASAGGAAASVIQGERASRQARRAGRQRANELRKAADVERERNRRLLASQRASFGAAGVTGAGTPLLVQAQSLIDSIRDQERILAGARFEERNAEARADALFLGGIAGGIAQLGQAASFLGKLPAPATSPASGSGSPPGPAGPQSSDDLLS